MKGRVLVTRPEPGATATAGRLRQLGFTPVVLPLTQIMPVDEQTYPDSGRIDAVVVTSVNGVRHVAHDVLEKFTGKPVYTVGDASAKAASVAGFTDIRSASGDARDLAALIVREMPEGSRLLHMAGVDRTAGFEDALLKNGLRLSVVETYQAQEISYSTDFLNSLFREGEISAALMMSPRASHLFVNAFLNVNASQAFERTVFFCISNNAANPLSKKFGAQVMISSEPTEESVLALLSSQF